MTVTTHLQGDLLLDVYEQCQTVAALYRQKEEAQVTGTDDDVKEVTDLYMKACDKLTLCCESAAAHGTPDTAIKTACEQGLPEELLLTIQPT